MSECQFVRSQRVILPSDMTGAEGVQGVIVSATTFVGREPEYGVQWLLCATADGNGSLVPRQGSLAESVLVAAQPPTMIASDEADKAVQVAFEKGLATRIDEYEGEIRKLQRKSARRRR
jgi:hypothetical protein